MKLGTFAVLCVLISSIAASAQRNVTNASLEKFRQKRLAAERDLRENYEKMGFPSPEELQRQNEESAVAREELANRLREERMQRDRIEAEFRLREMDSVGGTVVVVNEETGERGLFYGYGYSGYGYGYGYPDRNRRGRPYGGSEILWRAGPGGVIYEPGGRSSNVWSPVNNRQRPYFRQTTRRPVVGPRPILRPR